MLPKKEKTNSGDNQKPKRLSQTKQIYNTTLRDHHLLGQSLNRATQALSIIPTQHYHLSERRMKKRPKKNNF